VTRYLVNAYGYTYGVKAPSVAAVREMALEMSARWGGVVSYYEDREGRAVWLGAVRLPRREQEHRGARLRSGKQLVLF
jgi:hypothetical protein